LPKEKLEEEYRFRYYTHFLERCMQYTDFFTQ